MNAYKASNILHILSKMLQQSANANWFHGSTKEHLFLVQKDI